MTDYPAFFRAARAIEKVALKADLEPDRARAISYRLAAAPLSRARRQRLFERRGDDLARRLLARMRGDAP